MTRKAPVITPGMQDILNFLSHAKTGGWLDGNVLTAWFPLPGLRHEVRHLRIDEPRKALRRLEYHGLVARRRFGGRFPYFYHHERQPLPRWAGEARGGLAGHDAETGR